MGEFEQERPKQVAVASLPSWEPLQAWDRRTLLVAAALALIVIYAFFPTLANGFVGWDDDRNFLDNPQFRGLGPAEVKWACTTFWLGVYQPLAWLVFEAQYVFCKLDPRGYHITGLLFQVADAVVLYFLTVALLVRCRNGACLESPWTFSLSAGLATALFMVHPLRVEAVAWASCQPYLPCVLFSMLSVLAYLHAFPIDSSPRMVWLVGSFVLYMAAPLIQGRGGKPARGAPDPRCIPAPALWCRVQAMDWPFSADSALLEKVPFVIVSLVFMGLAIASRSQSPFLVKPYDVSEGIAQACYAIWFYIGKTVSPLNLIAVYPLPKKLDWLALPYGLSIVATLAMSAGLFLFRRRWPGLLAAWASYLVILAANSGLIRNNSFVIAADRYSYMAMLGSVMLAAAGFCGLWRMLSRWRRGAAIGIIPIGLGALLVLTAMTRDQCRTWRDTETLWAHGLAHGAGSRALAHYNLGTILLLNGKHDAAETHFLFALRLNPDYDDAHNNLGNVLYSRGKHDEAAAHYTEALRLNPRFPKAHNNLGTFLLGRGQLEAAEAHFALALGLDPNYADARCNLGAVLNAQGKYEAAAAHLTQALRLKPGLANAHYHLGISLGVRGKYEAAKARFAEALRLDPGNADAHHNLGVVLSRLGDYGAARAHFAEAIRLKPGGPDAYDASALLMAACPEAKFRDGKGAVQFATRACELTKWKDPRFVDTLAAAQAEAGEFDAALKSQSTAIELLTDERQKDDYRSRLALYQVKRPYRQVSLKDAPTEARP